jgi:hypothetical protein
MKKIVRLTESELTKIVKKVIYETEKKETEKNKVEDLVNDPEFLSAIRSKLSGMSDEQLDRIKSQLSDLGISKNSSIEQINSKVKSRKSDDSDESEADSELSEDSPQNKVSKKHKIANTLDDIGASSMSNFSNVITSGKKDFMGQVIAIGTNLLVSGLLLGIAKLLRK